MQLHRILLEAVFETKDTFNISRVIGLCPGETMERIEEMVQMGLDRERVSRVWG